MRAPALKLSKLSPAVEKRFWAKMQRLSEPLPDVGNKAVGPCWEWRRATKPPWGYGVVRINKKLLSAHRVAWFIAYGEIPAGLFVLHRCDNPPCCNPEHLFLGTNDDNVKDMCDKGRNAFGEGRNHKLAEADVLEIRRAYANRRNVPILQRELGERFKVTQSDISRIISGELWPHI